MDQEFCGVQARFGANYRLASVELLIATHRLPDRAGFRWTTASLG